MLDSNVVSCSRIVLLPFRDGVRREDGILTGGQDVLGGSTRGEYSNRERVLLKTAVPKFCTCALVSQNRKDIFSLRMATESALWS